MIQPDGDPSLSDHYEGVSEAHPIYEMGLHIHDPSRVVRYGDTRMIARSGSEQNGGYECGLETWWLEGEEWRPGQCLLIDKPTWTQIEEFASKIHSPSDGVYGICLRGLPGWGQNMALFGTMINSFGGRWFDMDWNPQLTSDEWKNAANAYVDLLNNYGPPGVTSNGFTESETLFANGQCGMWVDSTVAASYLSDPETSQIAENVGFAQAPYETTEKGSNWLFTWALAVPQSSKNQEAAKTFVDWATSKDYIQTVAADKGWLAVPPGTRQSTYASEEYVEAAPFAPLVETAIKSASPNDSSAQEVPYTGVQFVTIPQFQAIGTRVGQLMAAMLSGQSSVDEALQQGQTFTDRIMQQTGKPQ